MSRTASWSSSAWWCWSWPLAAGTCCSPPDLGLGRRRMGPSTRRPRPPPGRPPGTPRPTARLPRTAAGRSATTARRTSATGVTEQLASLSPNEAVGRTTAVTGTMEVAGDTVESVKIEADLTC